MPHRPNLGAGRWPAGRTVLGFRENGPSAKSATPMLRYAHQAKLGSRATTRSGAEPGLFRVPQLVRHAMRRRGALRGDHPGFQLHRALIAGRCVLELAAGEERHLPRLLYAPASAGCQRDRLPVGWRSRRRGSAQREVIAEVAMCSAAEFGCRRRALLESRRWPPGPCPVAHAPAPASPGGAWALPPGRSAMARPDQCESATASAEPARREDTTKPSWCHA